MRFIKIFGQKIKLLPTQEASLEESKCSTCESDFDTKTYRRACYNLCGHVACLRCILTSKSGCEQCEFPVTRVKQEKPVKSAVLVLSTALTKCLEENEFPEIRNLHLSALPVLDRLGDNSNFRNDREDNESVPQRAPKLEVSPDVFLPRYIPVVDLCDGVPIPMVDLTEDIGEDEIIEIDLSSLVDWDEEQPSTSLNSTSQLPSPSEAPQPEVDEGYSTCSTNSLDIHEPRLLRRRKQTRVISDTDTDGAPGLWKNLCKYCGNGFSSKKNLGLHITKFHHDVRPFPCLTCGWSFETQGRLQAHQNVHSLDRPYKCSQCNGNFKNKYALSGHVFRMHSKETSPPTLDLIPEDEAYSAVESEQFEDIRIIHESIQTRYTELPLTVSSTQNGARGEENSVDIKPFFLQPNHFPCSNCPEIFTRKSKLRKHLQEKHNDQRPYLCKECGWSFAKEKQLSTHLATHKPAKQYKCTQCDCSYNGKFNLTRHIKQAHSKKPSSSSPRLYKRNYRIRSHFCSQCHSSFYTEWQLINHVRGHFEERLHGCKMCNLRTFDRRHTLEEHMNKVHGIRLKMYPGETLPHDVDEYCPECESLFGSENCKKVAYIVCGHVSCMNCVIRAELGCGQCATENASKNAVIEESSEILESRTDTAAEKPRDGEILPGNSASRCETVGNSSSQCETVENSAPHCESVGNSASHCETVGNVAGSPEKRAYKRATQPRVRRRGKTIHKCRFCNETFSLKLDLGVHMQLEHSSARPFPCEVCQWPFSSQFDLVRHRVVHSKRKQFKCKDCFKSYRFKSTLTKHVKDYHDTDYEY